MYLRLVLKRILFFICRINPICRTVTFTCNLCGNRNRSPLSVVKGRETKSCYHCGSTLRFRSIIHVLSTELLGESTILKDFPINKDIRGIGLTGSELYSHSLERIFNYQNTYYHKEPKLDITDIREYNRDSNDFIIASDVFEHVRPPVSIPFKNLFELLKPNGICVLSVPLGEGKETIEHFPELYNFQIIKQGKKTILHNKSKEGRDQYFENLRFHGGDGSTLEMRIFSKKFLIEAAQASSFKDYKIYNDNVSKYGIYWEAYSSFPITFRKSTINQNKIENRNNP